MVLKAVAWKSEIEDTEKILGCCNKCEWLKFMGSIDVRDALDADLWCQC